MGIIFALLTSIFWAIAVYPYRKAALLISSETLNIFRLLLQSIMNFFILLILFRFDFNEYTNHATTEQWIYMGLSGIAGQAIGDYFAFISFANIGVRLTTSILVGAPALAYLMSLVLFNSTFSIIALSAIMLSCFGILLLIIQKKTDVKESSISNTLYKKGIASAIIATVMQAVGLVLMKKALLVGNQLNDFYVIGIRNVVSFLFLAMFYILTNRLIKNIKVVQVNFRQIIPIVLLAIILSNTIGSTFSSIALKELNPGIAQTFFCFEPIWITLISVFYYKEKLSRQSWIGLIIVFIGAAILNYK